MAIRLVAVDETILTTLVHEAITDAAADDVTPRLSSVADVWTDDRVAWLRAYHRRCRDGLHTATGEQSWAVVAGEKVLGSVRLAWTSMRRDIAEIGIWLTRSSRSRGVGEAAVTAALKIAESTGVSTVVADTTADNAAALRLLQRCEFRLETQANGQVRATRQLAGAQPAP